MKREKILEITGHRPETCYSKDTSSVPFVVKRRYRIVCLDFIGLKMVYPRK